MTVTTKSPPATQPTATQTSKKTSDAAALKLCIDGKWIDCTRFARYHPGGEEFITRVAGRDVTDEFHALHSQEACDKVLSMPECKAPEVLPPQLSQSALNFRAFRQELEKEGWFVRNWFMDGLLAFGVFFLASLGTYLAWSHPVIGAILIGMSMSQAAWVGHDHIHARGNVSYFLGGNIGALLNAFSRDWWVNKHSTHHVHTNELGVDEDLANDPILHLWIPEESNEVIYRRFQHLYYHFVFAFLFVSWRIQSFMNAYSKQLTTELIGITINYIWLLALPWKVSIGSVLIGGWLTAEVVTATHQSEEYIVEAEGMSFVEQQMRTTRDVNTGNPFMAYLWGGMEYQLEHHLFPKMPRYYFPALVPILEKFAEENGLERRESTVWEILKMNFETYRKNAMVGEEPTPSPYNLYPKKKDE
eukprot:TRINITY_DN221_c3_g1_i1.p1 TRINITY_DN221_c3_g1~~TRINITY_DN221_c3_g1_i1.p1  ORF type:complete len:417 (+),score=103.49 TRINITY_DN221_c3_g1_i1:403-1653(+)